MHVTTAERLVERYLALVIEHQPTQATALGDHSRDHDLPDLAPTAVDAYSRAVSELLNETEAALAVIPPDASGDDREARGDLDLLQRDLAARRFWLETRPSLQVDPLAALAIVSSGVHELLRRIELGGEAADMAAAAAIVRVQQTPRLLEQAGALLEGVPAPHLDVALQRCRGLAGLLGDELVREVVGAGGDHDAVAAASAEALAAVDAFAALLDELRGQPAIDWRLGPDAHATVLRSALGTDMAGPDIAARADAALSEACAELAELAGSAWADLVGPGPAPTDADERTRCLLRAIADRRAVGRDDLESEARTAVEEARAFALASGLTDVPPADLLSIREVPPFLQGIGVAFITPPPPLEPEQGCVFYLSPVPDHFDDAMATSFLREYNGAALRSLAVHEGYPGHFVQLAHAGEHPRLARRLLGSSAFAEGWAVYIERLVALRGFGDLDYRVTQLKMALRVATNALLDVSLHAGNLDDTRAIELMAGRAFQERQEADGKLVRAKVTSGQLSSYFVGGEEMRQLRADREAALGTDFDEVAFHRAVLSHGTPTTATVRAALADPAAVVRRPFA